MGRTLRREAVKDSSRGRREGHGGKAGKGRVTGSRLVEERDAVPIVAPFEEDLSSRR